MGLATNLQNLLLLSFFPKGEMMLESKINLQYWFLTLEKVIHHEFSKLYQFFTVQYLVISQYPNAVYF